MTKKLALHMTDDYYVFDDESLLKSRLQNRVSRQESLVRPERNSFRNPDHPYHYYAQKTKETNVHVNPSTTGVVPEESLLMDVPLKEFASSGEESYGESFKRAAVTTGSADTAVQDGAKRRVNDFNKPGREPFSLWQGYCLLVTFWAPPPLLKLFGMKTPAVQRAWRDKMGLISIILYLGAFVVFLTFGFSRTVCGTQGVRVPHSDISAGQVVIHGKVYSLVDSAHPGAPGIADGANVLYPPTSAAGMDASFLFQNVNGNCKGLVKPRDNSSIPFDSEGNMAWYFPCKLAYPVGRIQRAKLHRIKILCWLCVPHKRLSKGAILCSRRSRRSVLHVGRHQEFVAEVDGLQWRRHRPGGFGLATG